MLPAIFFIFRWTLPLSPIQFVNQLMSCDIILLFALLSHKSSHVVLLFWSLPRLASSSRDRDKTTVIISLVKDHVVILIPSLLHIALHCLYISFFLLQLACIGKAALGACDQNRYWQCLTCLDFSLVH